MSGTITKVSGPLVVANGLADANVSDVVRVGKQRLIGEILNMTGDSASIQVYEETSGLGPGATVETTGMPLSVELGPGMLENIYDGIQRPLPEIRDIAGSTITRGIEVPALNRERKWQFNPVVEAGAKVIGGDVIGTVQETSAILHKIMVPPNMKGVIKSITGGEFTVEQTVAVLTDEAGVDHELSMIQRWPVRIGRPYSSKYAPNRPMNSGQRIIDTLFPIAKGGTAAVGRHGRRPRPVRLRQDRRAAPARQMVRRGHRRLHRLRRARQRDDRRSDGVPRADRPAQRRAADEAYRPDCEHVRHARCGP